MGLEAASFVDGLNSSNPLAGDNTSQGDDHIRLLKSVLKATFPNATKAFRFPTTETKSDGATETVAASDENKTYSCTASSSGVTINLPSAPNTGFLIRVINNNGGADVTINRSGSDTINGSTSYTLSNQYEGADFIYIGSNVWLALRLGVYSTATRTSAGIVEEATESEVYASTNSKFLDAGHLDTAAAAAGVLSDATTISVDWSTFIYDTVTLSGNRTLGNPTNEVPGQFRTILVEGNNATERTLSFGSEYGGSVPTLDDITSTQKYILTIFCKSAGQFIVTSIDGSDA